MSRLWIAFVSWHAALIIAGGLIGAMYSRPMTGVAIAACCAVAWHLFNLHRLETWLSSGYLDRLPAGDGPWARVFAGVQYKIERRKSERKKFRRLIKELRAATKAFPDGGVILNENHEIINYNKAARALLGFRGKRDRGQRIENLIRYPGFLEYLKKPPGKTRVEIPAPLDSETWLSCRLIPYGPDQKLLLVRDISQRVKLESMRRDFVGNASHELRSPLTVITGYLDALGDDPQVPQEWRQPIADMREQADRMSQLVRDLLTLSRLESSEKSPLDNSVDLAAILATAKKEVLAGNSKRVVELVVDGNAKLLGDEVEIQSVVSNLISNAIRYTPEDGKIRISWRADETGGHLSVEDTGIGVAQDDIPRLTERFFRADGGRARQQGGTGLGLAIVKHALKRHDGELEISSKLGEGSVFTCHFAPRRLALS